MKSLSKIIARYLMTAVLIILVTLFLNLFLFVILAFQIVRSTNSLERTSREIAGELSVSDGQIVLSASGYEYLSSAYVWGMILNDAGQVIWEWQLPDHLNHAYTANDIARFSKWYLDDYPVTERVTEYGLLVVAYPRGTLWKYCVSDSVERIRVIMRMIPVSLGANLIFVFLLTLFFGSRFYHSLRGIAVGIQQLSEQKDIHLPERGMTELLARQLNQTSGILTAQREQLAKRDNARTSWISGVSHDIRTPLSLIMGYASAMKEDDSLSPQQQRQMEMIERQSLQIRQLIEDLNLTSRLEYDMQPLQIEAFKPARLLREIVSDFYNQGLGEHHLIDLYIDPALEQHTLSGDSKLLTRAFRNLIQNSIRHNPGGCTVTVTAYPTEKHICFQVSDNGCGIPENVIQALTGTLPDAGQQPSSDIQAKEKAPHIMGLRIARQVFHAHGWVMQFSDQRTIHILTG